MVLQVLVSAEKLLLRDADEDDHGGVDDMTKLTHLNEPEVLYNLERRYALNEIYVSQLVFCTHVFHCMYCCAVDLGSSSVVLMVINSSIFYSLCFSSLKILVVTDCRNKGYDHEDDQQISFMIYWS